MLATFFVMLMIFSVYWICHQHLKLVTNTFGLQHPSPTSMSPMLSGRYPGIVELLDYSCQIDDDRKILDRANLIAQNLFCQIIPIWLDWINFLNWITTIKPVRIIEPKLTLRRPLNFELTCTLSTFFPESKSITDVQR